MTGLTVLLPARNAEKTIGIALRSLLRGIPHDTTVLVLNDASEDATGTVVGAIARRDPRVKLLHTDSPSGVAGALNLLLAETHTPLVGRMDADDIVLPWRFRTQLRALKRGTLDMVFAPAIMFGPRRTSVRPQPPIGAGPDAVPFELLMGCSLLHPTMLGRRSAIIAAGGYRVVPAEDWDLFMRMTLDGRRVARLSLPGLLYRRHAGQMTANKAWRAAHSGHAETASVHDSLCEKLIGPSGGAYAALSGTNAGAGELAAAQRLLTDVWDRSGEFSPRDMLGVRANVIGVRRQLESRYPGVF